MKRIGVTICVLVVNMFMYAPFSFGFSMSQYWALTEGNTLVYDRELIVVGSETRTFGPYTGREYLMGSEYRGTQMFVYTGPEGVLLVGLQDREIDTYIDLSSSPIKIASAQMNLGDAATVIIPKGILDPDTATMITVTLIQLESLTVPAGTFNDCLKLEIKIQEALGNFTEHIWLAKGIGPVQIFRESETNGTDGCFMTCGSLNNDTGQVAERYIKLKGYYQQGAGGKVVVVPLGN